MTTVSAVLIAGPTASGKSALALDVAEGLGGVIVNADSMPEVIKYGSVAVGFAFLYGGRLQIKRRRNGR